MVVSRVISPAEPEFGERLRLRKATKEFESMLIADLMKMAETKGNRDGSNGMEGYDDMRIQAVSTALAANGGMGLSKMLLTQLDKGTEKDIKVLSFTADGQIAGRFSRRG